jgi:iron complex outermembrane receptor protein
MTALLAAGWTAASAQTASTPASAPANGTAVEEVVVTGIRQSLQSAVSMKKNTMEVVDSIRAEDIGKLPDPNVAETLTRVPGVQGYRYGGEGASPVGVGSGLTIRGLSGQTASQVDGRSYFTAGGSEFNIEAAIPGMIAGLDVYKNPSAEHIEGGIGGLVDVRTRRPLDLKGFTASAAISGKYNDMVKSLQPEYFGLIADRWSVGDGEMGLLLAGNYQKSWNRSDNAPGPGGANLRRVVRADSTEYTSARASDGVTPLYNQAFAGRGDMAFLADVPNPLALTAAERANLVNFAGVQVNENEEDIQRTRKGVNGAFQWKPTSNLEFYVDGNYNSYLYHQSYRFLNSSDSRYVQNLVTTPFSTTEGLASRNAQRRRGRDPGRPAFRQRHVRRLDLQQHGRRRAPALQDLDPGQRRQVEPDRGPRPEVRPFLRQGRPASGQPRGGHGAPDRSDLEHQPRYRRASTGRDLRSGSGQPGDLGLPELRQWHQQRL